MSDLAAYARAYPKRGMHVFPCKPKSKHPATANGFHDATDDPDQVAQWWERNPNYNIGIALGASNLFVLDIDGDDGAHRLGELEAEHGDLPQTWTQITHAGAHYVFRQPDGHDPIRSISQNTFGTTLEVKGDGGYIVAAPSNHPDGGVYQWAVGPKELDEPAEAPAWLVDYLDGLTARPTPNGHNGAPPRLEVVDYVDRRLEGIVGKIAATPEGNRNNALWWGARKAGRMIAGGDLDRHRAEARLRFAAERAGLDPAEIDGTIESGIAEGLREGPEDEAIASARARPGDGVSDRPAPVLDFIDGADLMGTAFPALRWAIKGLIPEGLTMFVGGPKTGKSVATVDLALSAAGRGKAFGGHFDPGPGKNVLVIAYEDSQRRLQERIRTFDPDVERRVLERVQFVTDWPTMPNGGVEALDKYLETHPHCELVFIDTFQRFRARGSSKSAYAEEYEDAKRLHEVAKKHRVAIVAIHHTRKAIADDFLDRISGTNGLAGAADTIILLDRPRHQTEGALHATGRDMPEVELAVEFVYPRWTVLGGAAAHRETKARREILDVLRDADEPLKTGQIATLVGKSTANTSKLLKGLELSNHVRSPAFGQWELADGQ